MRADTPRRQSDLRPSRLALLSTLVPAFIRAFFAANPLSQLGLSVARNGIAERLTELSGAPEAHVAALAAALRMDGGGGGGGGGAGSASSAAPVFGGDFSLQNALDQAAAALGGIPPYGTRELLLLQSALATCDPVRRERRVRLGARKGLAADAAWRRVRAGQHPRVRGGRQGGAPARLRHRPVRRGAPRRAPAQRRATPATLLRC